MSRAHITPHGGYGIGLRAGDRLLRRRLGGLPARGRAPTLADMQAFVSGFSVSRSWNRNSDRGYGTMGIL